MADMRLTQKNAVKLFLETLNPVQKQTLSVLLCFDGMTNLLRKALHGIPLEVKNPPPIARYEDKVEDMLRKAGWPEDAIARERGRL